MQDEELDKIINDAARQHHPPYDDKAWGKMQVLLDKHLPQKKDRRKPLALILLFLLVGSIVLLGILQPWKSTPLLSANNSNSSTKKEINSASLPEANTAANTNDRNSNAAANAGISAEEKITTAVGNNSTGTQIADASKRSYNSNGKTAMKTKRPSANYDPAGNEKIPGSIAGADISASAPEKINTPDENPAGSIAKAGEEKITPLTVKSTADKAEPVENKEAPAAANTTSSKAKNKPGHSFTNNFALTFSTGADISYVSLNNAGKLKLFYGAGVSYNLSKHFRVSSGFYVSKKVYSALPYQYKFPYGTVYPNLEKIDAVCNVYEIPLSVYYNFTTVKKHSWFAGTGLSSYLMKKEDYNYLYKTPAGQTYSYAKTINNENKHYFSVLTLSAGYQYKLNNRFSLLAEPYLKLPLSGIGAGKVNLNSTGLLFTAAFKPFAKHK